MSSIETENATNSITEKQVTVSNGADNASQTTQSILASTNGSNDSPSTQSTNASLTIATSTSTSQQITGKKRKRKREMTRWGPPPRKKRWGNKSDSTTNTTSNTPTPSLMSNLLQSKPSQSQNQSSALSTSAWNEAQTKIFLLKNQLQDVSTKLIAPAAFLATSQIAESSPSPEPTYDAKGVRINTREWRLREKLQNERINIIQQIIKLDSNYVPPSDYKPPKVTHKIMMPVEEYPDYNFFGLIVGPRGNTQKEMQKATQCKIAVRGQGACLDKPGRLIHADDSDPLHVHITAPNQECCDKAVKMIEDLLEEVKNGGSEHKAKQLRELATINGTLRIDARCRICGGQHPIYRCPERSGEKWTPAEVQCAICGELTHVTEDCKHFKKGTSVNAQPTLIGSRQNIDAEYRSFMNELVGDGPMSSNKPIAAIMAPTTTTTATTTNAANIKSAAQPVTNGNAMPTLNVGVNGYHNVPPPEQIGAAPPNEYKQNKDGQNDDEKKGNNVNMQSMMPPTMMMYHPPPPMMHPMMPMYGFPAPMNPFMQRPPPHPMYNPYGVPPMMMNPYGQHAHVPPPPPPPPPQQKEPK